MSTLNLESLDRYYFKFKFLIYGITYPIWGIISYMLITKSEPYWERFIVGAISFIYSFYCQKVIEKYGPVRNRIISQLIDLIVIIHYYSLVHRSEFWGENVLISYVFGFLVVMFATGFTSRSIVEIINWSVLSFMVTIIVAMKLEFMRPMLFILFIITLILFIMTIGVFSVKLLDNLKELNKNIESILQNLSQGIFTFNKEMKVQKEYSQYLESITGKDNLEGENVVDLLFQDSNIIKNKIDETKEVIKSFQGENEINYQINSDLLPTEIIKNINGDEKILDVTWEAITNEKDIVDKTMVIVKDVTELRKLQKESLKHKEELKLIGEVIKNGAGNTLQFLKSQDSFLFETMKLNLNDQNIKKILRNIHTIKGNARAYDLSKIVTVVHDCEKKILDFKEYNENLNETYQHELQSIHSEFNFYIELIENKIGFNQSTSNFYEQFYKIFSHLVSEKNTNDVVESLMQFKKSKDFVSLNKSLEEIVKSMPSIAVELGKETPIVELKFDLLVKKDKTRIIIDIFNHLFRNSIDHGIEIPDKRVEAKKQSHGTITVSLSSESEYTVFSYSDDGQGLNISSLKIKGIENNLISNKATDLDIANLIFSSGLSTKSEVTEISGRGVGMDAVKSFINDQNGKIEIILGDRLSETNVAFMFKLYFPNEFFSTHLEFDNLKHLIAS